MADVGTIGLTYDEAEATIVFRYLVPFRMESEGDVSAAISKIIRFWRDNCGGERVYMIVDYTNFSIDLRVNELFGREIKARLLDKCLVAIVRFGGTGDARAAARTRAIKAHVPSLLCDTIEEARQAVREMRAGRADTTR